MAFSVRAVSCFMALFSAVIVAAPRGLAQTPQLDGIATGKTRVIDLSYALSDKLVPWPGDARVFEARVHATVANNGYFTANLWFPEH